MTTYCSGIDLDSQLEGFVDRYYGTYLNEGTVFTYGTQYGEDMRLSFQQTNDKLRGINHIKTVPVATQTDGNYPYAVRMLQANLMIYDRLRSKHYGEFTDEIPGWIRNFLNKAKDAESSIRTQDVVFDLDVSQGESGIGVGLFSTHTGAARMYSNWETGIYTAADYPKTYYFDITDAGGIGTALYKWSKDGGISYEETGALTGTEWHGVESGLAVRWEHGAGTGVQCVVGDRFEVSCTPTNIPVKSGQVRFITFKRG